MNKYYIKVSAIMTATIEVNATCAGEAEEIIRDNLYPTTYINNTCGFECDGGTVRNLDCTDGEIKSMMEVR